MHVCKQQFSHYTCSYINFFVGNPTAIAATPLRLIPEGAQSINRPVLTAFVSGTPTPSMENITWYFNNGSLPEGVIQGGREVVFPSFVLSSLSGVYTVQVTTSRGTATDHFEVIITRECQYLMLRLLELWYIILENHYVCFLLFFFISKPTH